MINTKLLGQVFLFATIQSIIGSVEMSNKFCLISVTKDQETLQRAADGLTLYIIFGLFWAFGNITFFYSKYKFVGLWYSLIVNVLMMSIIIFNYINLFNKAVKQYNLKFPKLFDL
jgi:hypothetical protein